jgi:hypothetical protein
MEYSDAENGAWNTLAGVHQHLTYHIEKPILDKQGKKLTVLMNDLSVPFVFQDLQKQSDQINTIFGNIDSNLKKLKEQNMRMEITLQQMKQAQVKGSNC